MDSTTTDTTSVPFYQELNPKSQNKLLAIGEDIHILNPQVLQILESQDQQGLLNIAKAQTDAGAHSIDINLGQGKLFSRHMKWTIQTIQNHLHLPLFFSAPTNALPDILSIHKGEATINAVSANSATLGKTMEIAKKYDANLVILLVKSGFMTASVNDRVYIASEVLETARKTAFSLEKIYLDPILSTRPDPVTWRMSRGVPDIDAAVETIQYIKELSQGKCKTILSLSNGSLGLKDENRSALHCQMLSLFGDTGLDAAIMNCRDKDLMKINRTLNTDHNSPHLN